MRLIKAVTALLLVVCALAAQCQKYGATDENGEILKKLNAVAIDFTAK